MNRINQSFTLILILIMALSSLTLLVVKPASAQSTQIPSVPEFTFKYVDHSYNVPPTSPTYTTDPYTGKKTMVNPSYPSYHVDNRTIELWIKNQTYTHSIGSTTYHIYYDVRIKGHFEQNWFENKGNDVVIKLASMPFTNPTNVTTSEYISYGVPLATNSNYTILYFTGNLDVGSQEDFQVKALIGHDSQFWSSHVGVFGVQGNYEPAIAFDSESDWSPTQTFTIPNTNSSILPNIESIIVIAIVASLLVVGALLLYRRHRKTNN